jgi:hypothetical protein
MAHSTSRCHPFEWTTPPPQPALFEIITTKGLGVALCNLKVGSVNQQQTIPPNISLLPVLEFDLGGEMKDELRFDK